MRCWSGWRTEWWIIGWVAGCAEQRGNCNWTEQTPKAGELIWVNKEWNLELSSWIGWVSGLSSGAEKVKHCRLKCNLWSCKCAHLCTHFCSQNEQRGVFNYRKRSAVQYAKCWLADKWAAIGVRMRTEFTRKERNVKNSSKLQSTAWNHRQWLHQALQLFVCYNIPQLTDRPTTAQARPVVLHTLHTASIDTQHCLQVEGLSPSCQWTVNMRSLLNCKFCLRRSRVDTEWEAAGQWSEVVVDAAINVDFFNY